MQNENSSSHGVTSHDLSEKNTIGIKKVTKPPNLFEEALLGKLNHLAGIKKDSL